jgi:hypothetical protein
MILGAREKIVYRNKLAVPRFNTDALAEKAKTCKDKLVKGIRHISPLASVEGVSIFVFELVEGISRSQ